VTPGTVLLVVLIVQLEALTGLLFLQAIGVVSARRDRLRGPAVDRAREIVLRSVFTGRILPDAVPRLQLLPARVRARLLGDLGLEFTGADRQLLAGIAAPAGVLRRAGHDLRDRDWRTRLAGVNVLSSLGVGHRLSHRFLEDPSPAVRAAAAQWVTDTEPQEASLHAVIDLLADPHPMVRFAARVALLSAGQRAADLLLEREGGPAPVPVATVLSLAVPAPGFVELALSAAADPDPLLRRAAVPVLAQDGGERPRRELVRMLHDPEPAVRRAVARALPATGAVEAVRALARRARKDPDGLVRDACLRALPDLGPAGRLALDALAEPAGAGRGSARG